MSAAAPRILTVLIPAVGGQGGGVLSEWIVEAALHEGYPVQATSIPGVAQRTGSTSYVVELLDRPRAELGGREPVFSLFPVPGGLDVLLAPEFLEVGRAIELGFPSPERTTIIASTHRLYSIHEKMTTSGARYPQEDLERASRAFSRRFVGFDALALARANRTEANAVLLGALAATGVLPIPAAAFRAAIEKKGVQVEANLRGFEVGVGQVVPGTAAEPAASPTGPAGPGVPGSGVTSGSDAGLGSDAVLASGAGLGSGVASAAGGAPALDGATASAAAPVAAGPRAVSGDALASAVPPASAAALAAAVPATLAAEAARFPAPLQPTVGQALARLVDYQDRRYAERYLARLAPVVAADRAPWTLATLVARHLAVWMTYEDAVRVADLKTRRSRFARIRAGVRDPRAEVVVTDYLKPDWDEIYGILPDRLVRGFAAWAERRWPHGRPTLTQHVRTTTVLGFLRLWVLARLGRPLRPVSYRARHEHALMERWLGSVARLARLDYDLGCEVARGAGLVKGYGDVRRRMTAVFTGWLDAIEAAAAVDPAAARELAAHCRTLVLQGPEGEAAARAEASRRLAALAAESPAPAPAPVPR